MSVSEPKTPSAREGLRDFYIFVCAMAAAYIALIWALSFPPMQDYPMRMFIAFAAATFDDPQYNWPQFFELHNSYGSYSFTFWFVRAATPLFGVEAAGKLFLSLYVVLTGAFALSEARRRRSAPWPLVLLLPLAFNQTYIIGFMGYFFSIPVLLLALRHLGSVADKPLVPRRLAAHMAFQAVIFFCHPFTSALYGGFGALVCATKRGRALLRSAVLTGGFCLAFVLWFLSSGSGSAFEANLRWWPLSATLEFFALMFTGMQIKGGADPLALALWCAAAAVIVYCAFRAKRFSPARLDTIMLGLGIAGFLALPFSPGAPYTYFNIRLVAIVYFFGALVLSYIPVRRKAGMLLAAVAAGISVWQGALHVNLSRETAEIKPLLARMEKNSVILPVMQNGRSAHLDPVYFYQFHDHGPEYYHFLVGGGATPALIDNLPAFPVHYRLPQRMFEVAGSRRWEDYACCYEYVLARGERLSGLEHLGPFRRVAQSGMWTLFEVSLRRLP